MKINNIIPIVTICVTGLFITSCTDLDEELYGSLTPDSFYKNESEAFSSVAGAYSYYSYMFRAGGDGWRSGEYGTDELFCPGRSNGGWYDENVMQIMKHQVEPNNDRLYTCWTYNVFACIGLCNSVLASLESSAQADDIKPVIAEARAIRAFEYIFAMDFWGNVPIFTEARVSSDNLPTTNTRKEVYDFVVSELEKAIADLPSVTTVDASYYPRLTKEAAIAQLANVYLNAEVYAGESHWADVITQCDKIINTGAYALAENVGDCFLSTNEGTCKEVISAISVDPLNNVDGNQFILYTQHASDQNKYDLPFAPACGYCFDDVALNRYEKGDKRLDLLEYGPQYNLDGSPLEDTDHPGQQLVLTTIKDYIAAENTEGYRVLKYSPVGATFSGQDADNDYIVERYSDILLMKAEALFRQNPSDAEALELVNQVRRRSGLQNLTSLSLKAIETERANEFIWEGKRRSDMIRFGSYFTDTWTIKPTQTEQFRGIYPIPEKEINANPNLKQNPGY